MVNRDPIPSLIKLYSDNPCALDELGECRINPDLKSNQRSDLEFYIPQICSFYLQGYSSQSDELVDFILRAASAFHFSHRILFFFAAIQFNKLDQSQSEIQRNCISKVIDGLLGQISKHPERLFLTNSKEIQNVWQSFGLSQFYPQLK